MFVTLYWQVSHGVDAWANDFANKGKNIVDDQWVNEFSKLNVQDWADEFGQQVGEGVFGSNSADDWGDTYDKLVYLWL